MSYVEHDGGGVEGEGGTIGVPSGVDGGVDGGGGEGGGGEGVGGGGEGDGELEVDAGGDGEGGGGDGGGGGEVVVVAVQVPQLSGQISCRRSVEAPEYVCPMAANALSAYPAIVTPLIVVTGQAEAP